MKAYSKPQFKVGDKVYIKYTYMVAKNNGKLGEYNLPSFIQWLLSYCPFDDDCVGTIVKYKPDCKVLVRFNKPIFAKHPNKMDSKGYEAYLIDKVITDKPHSLINENQIDDNLSKLLRKDILCKDKDVYNAHELKKSYLNKIHGMSDIELYNECKDTIWSSVYTTNICIFDYNWHCEACRIECVRRNKENIYSQAYKEVF